MRALFDPRVTTILRNNLNVPSKALGQLGIYARRESLGKRKIKHVR